MPDRPLVAIVSNALTPFRLHVHRRIVREIPEIQLASLFTHGESNAPWKKSPVPEINPVEFGPEELATDQSRLRFAAHEWQKGGRVIRWLQDHHARAVVMLGYNDLGRLRTLRWCRNHGVPSFVWGDSNIRGDRATGLKRWVKRRFLSRVLPWCSGVMPCGSLGEAYFARYGVPREKMYRFPLEPDYDLIRTTTAADIEQVRRRFGLDPERRRIVYSGRLSPEKRVDLLLDAFAAIANDRPQWDLIIVGSGLLLEELKPRVPAPLASRVQWLGFIDDQRTINAIYFACDALVLPSDHDAWALVINEAVAAGLAVVSSDSVGAAAELVRDRVNGRIFPRCSLPDLIDCLRDVTDSATCARLRESAPQVLADWRNQSDPVDGFRKALQSVHVIPTPT